MIALQQGACKAIMRCSFLKSGPDPIDEQEFNTLLIGLLNGVQKKKKINRFIKQKQQSNLHSINKFPYKNIAITGLF